jgi:hypothetical protein
MDRKDLSVPRRLHQRGAGGQRLGVEKTAEHPGTVQFLMG